MLKDAPSRYKMIKDIRGRYKALEFDCFPRLLELSKRGNAVKVPCYVLVVYSTIMFCHLKSGVPQQFLKSKGVAAALAAVWAIGFL